MSDTWQRKGAYYLADANGHRISKAWPQGRKQPPRYSAWRRVGKQLHALIDCFDSVDDAKNALQEKGG